jgi:hypothetical protein
MLGWDVIVYKQADGGNSPANSESERGNSIAAWLTEMNGLNWLEALVKAGNAMDLGGNGYPLAFTATAEDLIPRFVQGPPLALKTLYLCEALSALANRDSETTVTGLVESAGCRMGEWLLIHAWDQS